jgi:hypothetical protein
LVKVPIWDGGSKATIINLDKFTGVMILISGWTNSIVLLTSISELSTRENVHARFYGGTFKSLLHSAGKISEKA